MRKKTNKAFSLVELSIVILIIGVLIAAVGQGMDLLADARLNAARVVTQGSRVSSVKSGNTWSQGQSFTLKVWDSNPAAVQYQLPAQGVGQIPQYTPARPLRHPILLKRLTIRTGLQSGSIKMQAVHLSVCQ